MSLTALKRNGVAPRRRVHLPDTNCRRSVPTTLSVRHTHHTKGSVCWEETSDVTVSTVFLCRSGVCGSHHWLLLQPLLHLLPQGEDGQGAPLQQPQTLRQPAGTLAPRPSLRRPRPLPLSFDTWSTETFRVFWEAKFYSETFEGSFGSVAIARLPRHSKSS